MGERSLRRSALVRVVRLARFVIAVSALLLTTGCRQRQQAAIARAELDRLQRFGVTGEVVLAPRGASFERVLQEARAQAGPEVTLLVLGAREASIDPGRALAERWTAEHSQTVVTRWAQPYLRVGDAQGAARGLVRGFVLEVHHLNGVRPEPPLAPVSGPRADWNDTDRTLRWGLPLAALAALVVWRVRQSGAAEDARDDEAPAPALAGASASPVGAPAASTASRRHDALAMALVGIVTIGAYLPTLEGPFLWDDRALIVDQLLEPGRETLVGDLFVRPFWRETAGEDAYRGFFRPMTTLTYLADARVHGDNPAGFHLTNVLLHLATVLAAFRLFRGLGARPVAAGLGVSLFALAPRLAECVAWISGRTDVLAALLGVLALLVYPLPSRLAQSPPPSPRSRDGASRVAPMRAVFAGLLLLASVLAKEVGLAFVGIIILDELQHAHFGGASEVARPVRWRAARDRLLPVALSLVVYLGLRGAALEGAPPVDTNYGGSRAITSLEALGTYAAMVVDFARPRTQIGFLLARDTTMVALGAVTALALALAFATMVRPWWQKRPVTPAPLLALLALGALLPVLHIVPLAVNIVAADRFLYTVLLATFGAVSIALDRLLREKPARARARVVAVAAGLSAALVSIVALTRRNALFSAEQAFWIDATLTSHPDNSLPFNELASVYYRGQEHDLALGLYAAAMARIPSGDRYRGAYVRTGGNLANVLSNQGRYDDALKVRAWMTQEVRATALDRFQIGLLHLHRGDLDAAERATEDALAQFRDFPAARQLAQRFPELKKTRAELAQADAESYARAAFLARIGARAEASRAFARLLARGLRDPEERSEAVSYLVNFADFELADSVLSRMGELPPPVALRLDERRRFHAEAMEAAPRLAPLLRPVKLDEILR